MTIRHLANQALPHFSMETRANGETYWQLSNNPPPWLYNLVYDAHNGMLPDDYRFMWIRVAIQDIREREEERDLEFDAQDDAHYFAEVWSDCMNDALLRWLSSNQSRISWVDEAMTVHDPVSVMQAIQMGQEMEITEVYHLVLQGLEKEASRS